MSTARDLDDGFRRILYDAMVLSASLRAVRSCIGYPKPSAAEIDGNVEAHHMNALIQIRSLDDFFIGRDHGRPDTIVVTNFPGSSSQPSCLPPNPSAQYRSTHTFVAHKSWDAVAKDPSVGAGQLSKSELVRIGLALLDGFDRFWSVCRAKNIGVLLNPYAQAYRSIYESNIAYLHKEGP